MLESSLYQLIYESMQEGLYVFDNFGKIAQINPAAQRILGYAADEAIGELGHYLFHAHSLNGKISLEECPIFQAYKNNVSFFGEEIFITKNKEYINVEVSCTPLMNEEGQSKGYLVLFRDIKERKELENRLKKQILSEIQKRTENEVFYNQIFKTANLGICLTDKNGIYIVVNPAYCEIYGYKESELVGQHFTKVVPDEQKKYMRDLHDLFIEKEQEEIPKEWDVEGKDGRPLRIVATAGRLDNVVGGPYKITTITDMTSAHMAQKLQKKQEAMLIQQSKLAAMGEMLGAIAHQWRQPLNVINCTSIDLRLKKNMGILSDESLEDAIVELTQMTNSMSKTIDDFMNFFRPNKTKAYFSLNTCVMYTVDILLAQLKNQGISLECKIDPTVEVFGAIGELEQVILNLITNARDAYDGKNKEKKPIRIYVENDEKWIKLIVEDEAGGIDEKYMDSLFDPYFTTKGDKQGTGIGLYMCEIIIEKTFAGKIEALNYKTTSGEKGVRMIIRLLHQGDKNESN